MGYEDALLNAGYTPAGVPPQKTGGGRGLEVLNQALGQMFQGMQQAQERKQKKVKDQFDMYKTLRDAGYDSQSAHAAVLKNQFPALPGGMGVDEEKKRAELAKTQADVGLSNAKTDYYKQGGPKRTVIDKMNPNQLQSRLKYLNDNGDPNDPNTKKEMDTLNKKLQKFSGIDTEEEPPAEEPDTKIKVKRKSDGKTGTVSLKNFNPATYEKI